MLKPKASRLLVGAIREEFPNLPVRLGVVDHIVFYIYVLLLISSLHSSATIQIHVHTHDTAGIGVASMLAAAEAGADAVDAATDALSGTTAQVILLHMIKHEHVLF